MTEIMHETPIICCTSMQTHHSILYLAALSICCAAFAFFTPEPIVHNLFQPIFVEEIFVLELRDTGSCYSYMDRRNIQPGMLRSRNHRGRYEKSTYLHLTPLYIIVKMCKCAFDCLVVMRRKFGNYPNPSDEKVHRVHLIWQS